MFFFIYFRTAKKRSGLGPDPSPAGPGPTIWVQVSQVQDWPLDSLAGVPNIIMLQPFAKCLALMIFLPMSHTPHSSESSHILVFEKIS